jgi:predicted transcriptional regulator
VATTQLLIRLPDALVRRLKRNVSVRHRSKFIERLLEDALRPEEGSDDDPLYQAALAVEEEHALTAEMAEWEAATIDDGLGDTGPSKKRGE